MKRGETNPTLKHTRRRRDDGWKTPAVSDVCLFHCELIMETVCLSVPLSC